MPDAVGRNWLTVGATKPIDDFAVRVEGLNRDCSAAGVGVDHKRIAQKYQRLRCESPLVIRSVAKPTAWSGVSL